MKQLLLIITVHFSFTTWNIICCHKCYLCNLRIEETGHKLANHITECVWQNYLNNTSLTIGYRFSFASQSVVLLQNMDHLLSITKNKSSSSTSATCPSRDCIAMSCSHNCSLPHCIPPFHSNSSLTSPMHLIFLDARTNLLWLKSIQTTHLFKTWKMAIFLLLLYMFAFGINNRDHSKCGMQSL